MLIINLFTNTNKNAITYSATILQNPNNKNQLLTQYQQH